MNSQFLINLHNAEVSESQKEYFADAHFLPGLDDKSNSHDPVLGYG
jgi:hypothetical protein